MSPLRPNLLAAKTRLAEGYQRLKERHLAGGSGLEVCEAIADLRDEALVGFYEEALADLGAAGNPLRPEIALVAHGGYGRRDVAPFSDVDLMILSPRGSAGAARGLAERFFRDVFDAGLVLGHSLRSPEEACALAADDPQILTSLCESRLVTGSDDLFADFATQFSRQVGRRWSGFLARIEKARVEERIKYGETVYLLEPNIKRSPGGLRDIQLLRWVGRIRYGSAESAELRRLGVLGEDDFRAIGRAGEFLLWLRNEIHFRADKPGDVLDRAEQVRIAQRLGYQAVAGMLPVEQFMRDYFRYTDQVRHTVARFVAKARASRGLGRVAAGLLGHRVEGGFAVGPHYIAATIRGRKRLRESLVSVMQLADLANLYAKAIEPETWEVVRAAAGRFGGETPPEARRHFVSLLKCPSRLGELLRLLHEAALLERFIPEFAHARGLLQFNQYHKYTVDEHCFRAVDQATDYLADPGSLGEAYRGLARKHLLHLALLVHDLGKGYPEDHCVAGKRIAEGAACRLGLDEEETSVVTFLVHRHLAMNHLVFRRDTSDENLIVRFSVEVGSPELLRMLYVLTAADLGAVGPGVWDSWKAEVVTELYHRAMQHLAGESPAGGPEEHLTQKRETIGEILRSEEALEWIQRQVAGLPAAYLQGTSAEQIAADLRLLGSLGPCGVEAYASYQPETGTAQYTVATTEAVTPGIFHRLTGALSSKGLQILSAQINTLADGLVLDRFRVIDPDFSGQPPAERFAQVSEALKAALGEAGSQQPVFRKIWRIGGQGEPTSHVARTRVQVDNRTSATHTIFDIFAVDRPGLLYRITRTLFELGLSVWSAKIGTYLDQVVDVFYVTDQQGQKIEGETRLQRIRQRLLDAVLKQEE